MSLTKDRFLKSNMNNINRWKEQESSGLWINQYSQTSVTPCFHL